MCEFGHVLKKHQSNVAFYPRTRLHTSKYNKDNNNNNDDDDDDINNDNNKNENIYGTVIIA